MRRPPGVQEVLDRAAEIFHRKLLELFELTVETTLTIGRLSRSVDSLELSVRCGRAMERLGIRTVGDLVMKTGSWLLAERGFGWAALTEVKQKLADLGLELKED